MARIVHASSPADLEIVRSLFREYQQAIGVDLAFQSFEEELRLLPGAYARPRGRLLLAFEEVGPAGCGGLRPIAHDVAELKRMWVRPAFRGRGLGRRIAAPGSLEGADARLRTWCARDRRASPRVPARGRNEMRATRFVLWFAWCALVAGCNVREMASGRGEAEKAVSEFHASFNAGRFGDIYDGASDEFRAAAQRQRFLELLGAVQRKLGKVSGTENKGWRVNSHNLRTYVELTQATRFDTGEAQETFGFVVRDRKAALLSYNIQSQELIVR